jgi:hypothetical protein
MSHRDLSDVLVSLDAVIPADHPVRAGGWDRASHALNTSYLYAAPEIYDIFWLKLQNICITYFTPFKEEEWTVRANAVVCNMSSITQAIDGSGEK